MRMSQARSLSVRLLLGVISISTATSFAFPTRPAAASPGTNGKVVAVYKQGNNTPELRVYASDATTFQYAITVAASASDELTSPAWSPDGTKIAYMLNGYAYIVNANGTNAHKVSSTFVDPEIIWAARPSTGVAWSPDGLRLAYSTLHAVYIVNIDGTHDHLLSQNANGAPTWSVRNEIAFTCIYDFINISPLKVVVYSPDGRFLREIMSNPWNLGGTQPAWSPDGSKLAFVVSSKGATLTAQVYIANADGTDVHQVSSGPEGSGNDRYSPTWSPDGLKLLYLASSQLFGFNVTLFRLDVATGIETTLFTTPNAESFSGPNWQAVDPPAYVFRLSNYSTHERLFTVDPDEALAAERLYAGWVIEGAAFRRVEAGDAGAVPVYRLTNYSQHQRLFTSSQAEVDAAQNYYKGWTYEGVAFYALQSGGSGNDPVYRLTNYSTGERIFTSDLLEATYAQLAYRGWVSEGVSFYTPKSFIAAYQPVYRLNNAAKHERLLTTSSIEAVTAIKNYPGWSFEGIAFQAPVTGTPDAEPVYRLTNTVTRERLYTISSGEAATVADLADWDNEGTAFLAYPSQVGTSVAVSRLTNGTTHDRLFTAFSNEFYNVLQMNGWGYEGVAFYAGQP